MLSPEFRKQFFKDTDHTGRHVCVSFRTGRSYYIEVMDGKRIEWGDLNPATGKVEGSYGQKYKGSISKDESLITEENGFHNIVTLEPGMSPAAYIEKVDAQYPDKE